jgi:NADH:ubiquinone oxidoreductase subunit E
MSWNLEEALSYYRTQGAPSDQNALLALLREIQQEFGGSIPEWTLTPVAEGYGVKTTLLLALIRRIPSLRLGDSHVLELCAGPNCGKHKALAACAEKLCAGTGGKVSLKFVPCMRMCGKGPNIRWDGVVHNSADEALLRRLLEP